jgi:hypothetical protein
MGAREEPLRGCDGDCKHASRQAGDEQAFHEFTDLYRRELEVMRVASSRSRPNHSADRLLDQIGCVRPCSEKRAVDVTAGAGRCRTPAGVLGKAKLWQHKQ